MKLNRWLHLGGAVLFGLLVHACLPAQIVPLDDDFGYLRSVVETLQHHRPWTDDWLGPWAASFSVISALLYAVTGNFYFATYGLLVILAAASFGLCSVLIAQRTSSVPMALVLTAIGLTFPTLFWKTIQFTGMALYIPCLFGAIWVFERRRWGCFLVFWCLAIGTRQSAIVWIALPFGSVVWSLWKEKAAVIAKVVWLPAVTMLAGLALFAVLSFFMNKTHAQRIVTDRLFEQFSFANIQRPALLGGGIFLLMAGMGTSISALSAPVKLRAKTFRGPAICGLLALGAIASLCIDIRWLFSWEQTTLSGTLGLIYVKLLIATGILGWVFHGRAWQPALILCAVASIALLSVRAATWDYYFVDVAVLGLFARHGGKDAGTFAK